MSRKEVSSIKTSVVSCTGLSVVVVVGLVYDKLRCSTEHVLSASHQTAFVLPQA